MKAKKAKRTKAEAFRMMETKIWLNAVGTLGCQRPASHQQLLEHFCEVIIKTRDADDEDHAGHFWDSTGNNDHGLNFAWLELFQIAESIVETKKSRDLN